MQYALTEPETNASLMRHLHAHACSYMQTCVKITAKHIKHKPAVSTVSETAGLEDFFS